MSSARVWTCRYSKRLPRRGDHFGHRHARTPAMDMPSANAEMEPNGRRRLARDDSSMRRATHPRRSPSACYARRPLQGGRGAHARPPSAGERLGTGARHMRRTHLLYIGSISASPTACPSRGYRRAGTQNDRLSEVVTAIPTRWTCPRRCRDGGRSNGPSRQTSGRHRLLCRLVCCFLHGTIVATVVPTAIYSSDDCGPSHRLFISTCCLQRRL